MKKQIILILCLVSTLSFSQTATYQQVISKEKKGDLNEYITKNGESFKVGDTIKLGVPFRNENFDFIQQNAMPIAYYPLISFCSGATVVIKRINIMMKTVRVFTTHPQGMVYGLIINNIDEALINGEIRSSTLSSEQALEKLKNEKTKLDLGLISQEKYDSLKTELSKYIK